MQILSLIFAVILGVGIGIVNGLIGLETGYSATSLLFFVVLPLGAGLLGIPAGFAAGWFDQSHKGQSSALLFLWAIIGGALAIVANYVTLYVQSGAMSAGYSFIEFTNILFDSTEISGRRGSGGFETGELGRILGYLEVAAAAFGGVIGMGMGIGASRSAAGTKRMPYHFDDIADVLVAMVGVDGSIDDDEKQMAAIGLQISLNDWFENPSEKLQHEIQIHTAETVEAKVAAFGTGNVDLDAQLAKLKNGGEQVVNATCIGVFSVAAADDVIDPAEEKLLRDIVAKLGLPEDAYNSYLEIGKQLAAAVNPKASADVVEEAIEDAIDDGEDVVEEAEEAAEKPNG